MFEPRREKKSSQESSSDSFQRGKFLVERVPSKLPSVLRKFRKTSCGGARTPEFSCILSSRLIVRSIRVSSISCQDLGERDQTPDLRNWGIVIVFRVEN